ncbi:uroporphyrinogen-III C-methyltransferase [Streptomyces cinereospinus]
MAEHPAYPVGLRLAGRRAVVLGGGQVAQRRLPALIAAGADVLLVSPQATPSVEAMADAGEITWERRPYAEGDLADAWYALIATSDHEANTRASAEAERHRVWCVRSDDADAATAWTPATGHSEGVTVAVLTTDTKSRDPRHTAAVRDAVVEGLRDGTLVAPHHRTRTPGVALVGGGPGDPDLITVRGRRLLAEADVVIADRLGPRDLLAELPPHVEVIDAAKIPYGRSMAQEAINNALIEHAKQGKSVVRLKGGDPFVFGRGMEEAQALAEAGIPCTVVPGISSSISVPGAAGIPVTHRGVAHEFTVVSGHVAPRRRALPGGLAVARQAHRHAGDPDGRRQDRQDRGDPRRARQAGRHARRPGPGGHDRGAAPRRRDPGDGRRDGPRTAGQAAGGHRRR